MEKKKPSAKKKRATQLPDGWTPIDRHRDLARSLGVHMEAEVPAFKDYHLSKGSTFKDWDRAFNTWLRNAKKFGAAKPSPTSQAARVTNETPQQPITERQTQGLEHVSGEKPSRDDEADAWLEAHPDEADELLGVVQDEMAWALANTRNAEVQGGMIRAALRKKALERIDHQEAA